MRVETLPPSPEWFLTIDGYICKCKNCGYVACANFSMQEAESLYEKHWHETHDEEK